jgi:hypothetical protein
MNFKKWIAPFYNDKYRKGYQWIYGITGVCIILAVLLTLLYREGKAAEFLRSIRIEDEEFPVYLFLTAVLLALPAFSISKRIAARFNNVSNRKGALLLLLIFAVYAGLAFLPEIFLPKAFPVFTGFLMTSFFTVFFVFWAFSFFAERILKKEKSEKQVNEEK